MNNKNNSQKNSLTSVVIGYVTTAFLNSGFTYAMYLLIVFMVLNPHIQTVGIVNSIINFISIMLMLLLVMAITYQETYIFIYTTHCPDCATGIPVMSVVSIISFIVMLIEGLFHCLTIHTVIVASIIQFIIVLISLSIITRLVINEGNKR